MSNSIVICPKCDKKQVAPFRTKSAKVKCCKCDKIFTAKRDKMTVWL